MKKFSIIILFTLLFSQIFSYNSFSSNSNSVNNTTGSKTQAPNVVLAYTEVKSSNVASTAKEVKSSNVASTAKNTLEPTKTSKSTVAPKENIDTKSTTTKATNAISKYGVFIGMDPSNISKLLGYNEVVIDGSYYTKEQIDYLHSNGIKVYSYLNIGSIENFRDYYKDFVHITLGDYENWPDEKWIDVSNPAWQEYVVNTLAKDLMSKGIDGLFLDNLDVYYVYNEDKIYNGLVTIINRLNQTYNKPLIANGGYDFFTKAMEYNLSLDKLVYAVNTESVYTTIDWSTNTFKKNSTTDRNYAVEYLNILKNKGLKIYVIEYTKNKSLKTTIMNYHNNLEFTCYVSSSLNLD